MELTRGQNLFEALERVCDFIALEGDMDEIINAVEADNVEFQRQQLKALFDRHKDETGKLSMDEPTAQRLLKSL